MGAAGRGARGGIVGTRAPRPAGAKAKPAQTTAATITTHATNNKQLKTTTITQHTNKQQTINNKPTTKRQPPQGLVVASDYKRGQQLVSDREFADNAAFFADAFEVGRRYKVRSRSRRTLQGGPRRGTP